MLEGSNLVNDGLVALQRGKMKKITEQQIAGAIEREKVYEKYNKEHPIKKTWYAKSKGN